MPTTSRITIDVTTDDNQVPVSMEWTAEDGGIAQQPASAMALAMWNAKEHAAMRMDLWTKDMSVEEMRSFMVQTIMTLADTYERATSDKDHANALRGFTEELAKRIGPRPRAPTLGTTCWWKPRTSARLFL